MKLSFLPGDLHLNREQDGSYLVIMQGQELLRTRIEKKALVKFNAVRRELESQFPARELTPDEKRAALDKYLMDYKAIQVRASTKPPKKEKIEALEPSVSLPMPQAANDPHYFDFDLDRGIRLQVVEKLDASPLLPLEKNIGPALSGIYALYHKGTLVYAGKATKEMTKSKRTLRSRLNEHVGKIRKRQNIELTEMQCRYLTFASEWWVFAAEFAVVVHYKPEWNFSGFGSKTPGKGTSGNRTD